MATTRAHVVLALLVTCLLLNVAQGCVMTIRNRCSFPVTACSRSDGTQTSQYQLAAGASQGIDLGSACRWIAGVVFASVGGDCGDTNLANLAEFTIGKEDVNNVDFYDLSNVDAYTIGLQIVANRAGCTSPVCSIADIRGFCQGTNRLDTFPTGALSCHNTDGQIGFATDNNRLFKQACPDAYSYDKDDTSSTFTCATGTDYDVVFCP